MKAIGIVRKIDELGRVVIPKEIRTTQGWDEGQPMEMFMNKDGLVLKPYGNNEGKAEVLTQLTLLQNSENEAVRTIAKNTIEFIERG